MGADQRIMGNRVGIELLHSQPYPPCVQVAHQQFRPRRMQLFGQGVANITQPLHRYAQAFEVVAAQAGIGRGADAGEYPHRRMR